MGGAIRAVVVAALLAGALAGGCKRSELEAQTPPPVRLERAEAAPGGNAIRYSASIQSPTQINVSFKVGGYIAHIAEGAGQRVLQEGDRVRAGTVMARVEPRDYQVQADNAEAQVREAEAGRVQADAQLRAAQAGLPQAEAQVAAAQATLDKAERDWARAQALYAAQALTRPDYDAARMSHQTAAANLDGARAAVDSANAQIANARAQVNQGAAKVASARQQLAAQQIPLGDTALRAPADAVVLSRKIEVGSFVQPGTVGFVVATTNPVKAVFSVPDTVVRTLSPGQVLTVSADDAGPGARWRGPITAISPAADAQTRVFQVEVTLPNPHNELRIGMIVSVPVGAAARPAALPAVPLPAVVRPGPGTTGYAVFVVEDRDGRLVARRREVVLGEVLGNRIVVREGLRLGERVVVSGATIVTDGQVVKALP
jgi:RND family efflux transporter MFP subunit